MRTGTRAWGDRGWRVVTANEREEQEREREREVTAKRTALAGWEGGYWHDFCYTNAFA